VKSLGIRTTTTTIGRMETFHNTVAVERELYFVPTGPNIYCT